VKIVEVRKGTKIEAAIETEKLLHALAIERK